jgi:membrane-associated phospholipid phosphatase
MRSQKYRLVAGAAACFGAAGAVLLATYVLEPIGHWDVAAFTQLQGLDTHPRLLWLTHRIVHFGDPLPAVLIMAMIGVAGLAWGRARHVVAAALLVGAAAITTATLKVVLAHPRYQGILGADRLAANAFPSGHATTAMSVALAAVLVAPRRWRLFTAIAGACYALAIGSSLLINGWHYPSDVIGGFLVATSFGLLAIAGLRLSEGERKAPRQVIWPHSRLRALDSYSLAAPVGGVTVAFAVVAVAHAPKLLSYWQANTSAVVATIGLALASIALVYGIAVEANRR